MIGMSSSDRRVEESIGGVRNNLRGIGLLSGLDAKALRNLERQCLWHELAANQMILGRSDYAAHHIYFVVEGTVRIVNYAPSGREIAFANIRKGSYFGELGALTDEPRSASVVAVTDCRLASLAPQVFERLLLDNPALAIRVVRQLAEIIRRCDQRIMDLSTLSAVQRVHVDLLRRAKPDIVAPENWVVRPVPTQSDIASRASTTRETVSRAMHHLAVAGIVERKGKTLYVRNQERLAELTEAGAAQSLAAH